MKNTNNINSEKFYSELATGQPYTSNQDDTVSPITETPQLTTQDKISLLENEFLDVAYVVELGARKYKDKNWLEPAGKKSSFKEMHESMFHHLAESWAQGHINHRGDKETNFDPLLHLACRALMLYTRIQRNIKHITD